MEDKKNHIVDFIKDEKQPSKKKLNKFLKKAPFAQSLHFMNKKDPTAAAMMRFDWIINDKTDNYAEIEDCINISSFSLKDLKKKKKKRRKKEIVKTDKKDKPNRAKTKKSKSLKASNNSKNRNKPVVNKLNSVSELDQFTQWINTIGKSDDFSVSKILEQPKKAQVKKKKKNKSKENKSVKHSDHLKKKIDTSIQTKKEIASETLAELYIEQGYKKKALAIYEQLSLTNPEKSSFFAVQIKNLKKQIK